MNRLLQSLIEEFHKKMETFTGGIEREFSFPDIPDKILVAVGMRRTGKTYFLFQTIQKLLKEVPVTRILYLNFEDDRLLPMTQPGQAFFSWTIKVPNDWIASPPAEVRNDGRLQVHRPGQLQHHVC